ncbi:MAG: dephospho-CoA kinase, partial [Myxococcota bacterium]
MARVIGLTGGIASGKSTVAAALRELGAQVIDADQLARQVVEPGQPAFTEIADRFGARVIDPDGRIDRKALGAIVFADPKARRDLEAITHPRIRAASGAAIVELAAKGHDPIIYEAALIVEKALHEQPWMDGLIVVAVPLEVQRQRLMARDGMTFEAAEQRLAAQLPLADKVAAADHVIDNAGSVADTRAR